MAQRGPRIATGKARLLERLRAKAQAASPLAVEELSFAVVGARFENPKRKGKARGNRETEIMMCVSGDPVTLEAEPANKADGNAIAVYSRTGVQIGYIAADRTSIIHRAWHDAKDVLAIFQHATGYGAVIRVSLNGEAPTLPPAPDPTLVTASEGFYPDPDMDFDGVDWIPPDE